MNLTKYQANGMTFSNLKLTGSSVNIDRLNKFVSNVKSVPDLARLADNIGPVIRPIAILLSPYR